MRRTTLVLALCLVACDSRSGQGPPPVAPCQPEVPGTSDGYQPVWGFADLHTHPGIEVSFGQTHLVWGSAHERSGQVSAADLPQLPPCPVETHLTDATGPLDRTANTLVLPLLNQQANFPHGPIGSHSGRRVLTAWPDGRDVLHQQMQASSIRRAYEGGLRVLLASVTDSQVLTQLLTGPEFPDVFVPHQRLELESARRQLQDIEALVAENASWMRIARSPEDARAAIEEGYLAVVLSLEMDGLSRSDIESLIDEFGVGHVIPIHLVDNAQGGTAAYSDVANASSSQLAPMFGRDYLSFIDVEPTGRYLTRLSWPLYVIPFDPPILFDQSPVPYPWYRTLGYENTCICDSSTMQVFANAGHENVLGLTAEGEGTIRVLMERGVILDVSHMGYRSTARALEIAEERGYPLIASHGGVGPETGPTGSERDLAADQAARLAALHGLVGLGTGGPYQTFPRVIARGGPLLSIARASTTGHACAAIGGEGGCAPALSTLGSGTDPDAQLTMLRVEIEGTSSGADASALRSVRLTLSDPTRTSVATVLAVPLTCTASECVADIAIPTQVPIAGPETVMCGAPSTEPRAFRVRDVASVTFGWVDTAGALTCRGVAAGSWAVTRARLTADGGAVLADRAGAPWATLSPARGGMTLYQASDQPELSPVTERTTDIVRIELRASGDTQPLGGAGAARYGADVCAALRLRACPECECVPNAPPASDATGCPAGWVSVGQRGEWVPGVPYDAFTRVPGGDVSRVCGVDVAIVDWSDEHESWTLDEMRLEAIDDPVLGFVDAYLDATSRVFMGEPGRVAFGTDMNGLAPQIPISAFDAPDDHAVSAWSCESEAIPTLRVRGSGREVRLSQRGLATYGLLSDLLGVIEAHPRICEGRRRAVIDSMMLSADATIRTWERSRAIAAGETPREITLPVIDPSCGAGGG